MTSGGNSFNYFPENQVIKFSAVDLLQLKHSEKNEDVLFRTSAVLFCRAVSSSHRRKSKWKWKCPRRTIVIDKTVLLGHFLTFWPVFCIKMDKKLSALGEGLGWGSGGSHLPNGNAGGSAPIPHL